MAKLPQFGPEQDDVRIRGYSQRVRSLATRHDILLVVGALRLDHFDPGGREITDIGNFQKKYPQITVRLDRQANTSDGAANLQVQVNNVALSRIKLMDIEGTTIAQVIVPKAIYRAAFACHELSVRTHLENVVRRALQLSADSHGYQFKIADA